MQNEIEIDRKNGIKIKCNPCNFKIISSTKTIAVEKKGNDIVFDTPENDNECEAISKIIREVVKNS